MQKIIPFLWFDDRAQEAVGLYTSTFKNSKILYSSYYSKAGAKVSGMSEGTLMSVSFEIEGQGFAAINGGPVFKFTPSVSFLVACGTIEETGYIWSRLSENGEPMMDLGEYPFSKKYGWTRDAYGMSWQVMYMGDRKISQKIVPTVMFSGSQSGNAETAVNFYASVFKNSGIGSILRYTKEDAPDIEGTIRHVGFTLEKQEFAAMDSNRDYDFSFSEANSFMVKCKNQREIDNYWDDLTSGGGQEGVCGWLKDRFGMSWQVVPEILDKMLRDSDAAKVERVSHAFLEMKKFDIGLLEKAYDGSMKNDRSL
jgi:predicted 3-demethylubiquinone-9 3-methyltransferase (glyoxalase superfamily)